MLSEEHHNRQVIELVARIIEVVDGEDQVLVEEAAVMLLAYTIIAQTKAGEERAAHVDMVLKFIRERIHQLPEMPIATLMKQ